MNEASMQYGLVLAVPELLKCSLRPCTPVRRPKASMLL